MFAILAILLMLTLEHVIFNALLMLTEIFMENVSATMDIIVKEINVFLRVPAKMVWSGVLQVVSALMVKLLIASLINVLIVILRAEW